MYSSQKHHRVQETETARRRERRKEREFWTEATPVDLGNLLLARTSKVGSVLDEDVLWAWDVLPEVWREESIRL